MLLTRYSYIISATCLLNSSFAFCVLYRPLVRVVHREDVPLHSLSEQVEKIKGETDVLGVALEINDQFVSILLMRQV